ncbi:MAG: hypothetical protein ACLPN5_00520 [Roseiarcus sp.]
MARTTAYVPRAFGEYCVGTLKIADSPGSGKGASARMVILIEPGKARQMFRAYPPP